MRHVEVPRLGVESELQLLACTTATATWDPSHICDLHHSTRQYQILNTLSEARDGTQILMDPSQVTFAEPQQELPSLYLLLLFFFFPCLLSFQGRTHSIRRFPG